MSQEPGSKVFKVLWSDDLEPSVRHGKVVAFGKNGKSRRVQASDGSIEGIALWSSSIAVAITKEITRLSRLGNPNDPYTKDKYYRPWRMLTLCCRLQRLIRRLERHGIDI